MKKILLLFILNQIAFGHGPHGNFGSNHYHTGETVEFLSNYTGDFTDSDGDGMTDAAERRYGYNPLDEASFPTTDFVLTVEEEPQGIAIASYEFMDLRLFVGNSGISLEWSDVEGDYNYSKYSLSLNVDDQSLYYGGHGWEDAKINYGDFSLIGTELLSGYFIESNPENGEWIKNHPEFQIDLNDYPLELITFGDSSNKIKFKFIHFKDEQKERYIDFMRRVIPIINDILGVPSESFTCEFIMQEEQGSSWVTMEHGRKIYLDSYWNPRLLVHEMIHMWEGQLGFSWSGKNREYSDDLSGFAEVAEGIAYKILHDYVSAYPTHYVSEDTALGGPWNNWTSDAWSYDLYKHQRFTGGGTFWTGDLHAVNHRYSISGMLMQIILVQDPDFLKNMRSDLFEIVNKDNKILTRNEIVELWAKNIDTINGIDTTQYLNAMPVLNGHEIDQGFYPMVNILNQTDLDVLSSYSVNGYFWWNWVTNDNVQNFDIPNWVNYNYNSSDGFYYIDMNDMPYTLSVKNIHNELIKSLDLRSDNSYQDKEKIIPESIGMRISGDNDIAPEHFLQGLYRYNITYTDIIQFTDEASEDFYFMGEKNLSQNEDEIMIMIGVDSLFAESVNVTAEDYSFKLDVENGCAILKTSNIPLNKEMMLSIKVNSHDESHTYLRALVHAGNSWGMYRQQFLIIDQDFDGIEDLYDDNINLELIDQKYTEYRSNHSSGENKESTSDDSDNSGTGGSGDSVHKFSWAEARDLGSGWWQVDWFGNFYQSTVSGWVYHISLGWIYVPDGQESLSLWIYSWKFGWIWTGKEHYPYVFIRNEGEWFYFIKGAYFDFKIQQWIPIE